MSGIDVATAPNNGPTHIQPRMPDSTKPDESTMPSTVSVLLRVGAEVGMLDNCNPAPTDNALANPKSSSLAPDFVSMMLPGLRSR